MKTHSLIAVVVMWPMWLSVLAARQTDTVPEKAAAPVSSAMSLAEIEAALTQYPPAWAHGDARAAVAASLDRQVTVQARDGMTDEDRAKLQPLLEFYRTRVDAGLDVLEKTTVTDGVLVVKFYSSSLVLKSAAGTVAVDFCQGPINNGGEPETRDDRRTGFFWTAEQRDRLARLVDLSLITHRHHDHADYSLARRLVARGKPVVGPSQLKELWPDLADGIKVPPCDQGQQVGPVEIYTWLGRQYSRNAPGADGQREGVPGADPSHETESNVYLLRVGGIVFLQGAENHVPAGEWLERGIAAGWAPDVVLSTGQYQGQRSIDAVLRQRPPVFHIPVHEYEMMHDGGGNRTSPWFTGSARQAFDRHQAMPLFWGEGFPLTRAQLSASGASPLPPQSDTSVQVQSDASVQVLVEAEAFAQYGGWLLDPQFTDQMGSPYLLAHGLGQPVANAKTEIEFPKTGRYHVWVRAKDWVPTHHPGRFRVLVGDQVLEPTFGENGVDWSWQSGGHVDVTTRKLTVELQDLTGFDGRCDALYFTTDQDAVPPQRADEAMAAWRRKGSGLPDTPPLAGEFDVVVTGGGIAGCATALTAARLGAKVALIQDRPLLGGNASDEVGLTPRGEMHTIVSEIASPGRERVLQAEPNIKLFLSWRAFRVQKAGTRIASLDAKHTATNEELRFQAPVFVDCTGVGGVGFLAGADYRLGREARTEFDESLAPVEADTMHHGNTPVFRTRQAERPVIFPDVPWAVAVAGDYADLGGQVLGPGRDNAGGITHFWEYGQWLDPFADAERIRDHLLCAVYGTFANAKRNEPVQFANLELEFVGHVLAGGESRRLMGDYVLTENDIRAQRSFPDAVANQSGHFCLHYPGDEHDFRLGDWKWIAVPPYSVPFRCLYSRNVDNLLMAGKHISVTHVAGSSTKTMLNGGQHGVAAGAAAFLCQKHGTTPRGVYEQHLRELQEAVFGRRVFHVRDFGAVPDGETDSGDAIRAAIAAAVGATGSAEAPVEVVLDAGTYRVPPASKTDRTDDAARQAELAKWDAAESHRSQTGPGGTEWDGQYRSFIQTDDNAAAKGFPRHAEAARQIKEDAAKSPAALAKHLGWVLFIKHFSQAYRPEEATADLRRLYEDLVDMKLAGSSRPQSLPFDGDPRLVIHRDVVYGKTHPEIQRLDAYLVKSDKPTPVAIEIHGSGWRRGSKSQFVYQGNLIDAILDAGISVVAIDYRLTPEHTMPAQLEDAVRAVQFVRSMAKEWNLDADRMAVLGGSAGAHLAAWVALHDDCAQADTADPVERCSSRVACFVPLSGPMDLTRVRPTELARQPLRGQDFANAFTAAFGCSAEQFEQDPAVRQRIRDASPLFLVTPDDPPAFVMGGWNDPQAVLRDPPVPAVINDPHSIWHGVLLAEALRKAGVPVVIRIGPDVGKDPGADSGTIVAFLRQQLFSQKDAR